MKKQFLWLLLASSLISCGGEQESSSKTSQEEILVSDGIGRENSYLPGSYSRIACVGAGALRLYSYIGELHKLVGVEDIDNPSKREEKTHPFEGVARPYYDANKEAFRNLPSLGVGGPVANQSGPNLTLLTSLAPDLVISDFETVEQAKAIENATGAKVFTIRYGKKAVYDETIVSVLTSLGKVLDRNVRAKTLTDYISSSITELKTMTKNVKEEDKPLTYVGGIGNWGQKDYLATHSGYPMFEATNIKNVLSEVQLSAAGQQDISKATFEELAPKMDKLILDAAGMKQTIQAYHTDKHVFDNVKAVTSGEVYLQMPYNAYYTNLEISLMNGYFDAYAVYPELFKDFDLEKKYSEILTTFVGKDTYTEEKGMSGSYGGHQKISDLKKFCEEHIQ